MFNQNNKTMKTKFFIIAALSISVLLSSCGSMGSASSSSSALSSTSSAQFTAGQNAGTALRNLYTQYKASGKFDYTNMNNMVSVMQLIAAAQSIKDAGKNTTAYKDFSKGLILGSVNLVTTSIADTSCKYFDGYFTFSLYYAIMKMSNRIFRLPIENFY